MGNLTSTHKTNITAIDTAIGTALASLKDPNDSAQRASIVVLRQMRRLLGQLTQERAF